MADNLSQSVDIKDDAPAGDAASNANHSPRNLSANSANGREEATSLVESSKQTLLNLVGDDPSNVKDFSGAEVKGKKTQTITTTFS